MEWIEDMVSDLLACFSEARWQDISLVRLAYLARAVNSGYFKKLGLGRGQARERYASISIARGKFTEGIEFVDEESGESAIDCGGVAGIPYLVLDGCQRRKMEKVAGRLGEGTPKVRLLLAQPALTALRQAIGRAIRTPADRATIILADSRFREEFWQRELVNGSIKERF